MAEHSQDRKPIVVGVDGSPQSLEALRQARRLAELTGTRLRAVTAWQYPPMFAGFAPPMDWSPHDDAEQVLTEALGTAFDGGAPADLERAVVQGQPAHVLTEESRGAEMLVVGSRGRGGFAGLLLGSVSSTVAAHAHCPVLITHEEPEAA